MWKVGNFGIQCCAKSHIIVSLVKLSLMEMGMGGNRNEFAGIVREWELVSEYRYINFGNWKEWEGLGILKTTAARPKAATCFGLCSLQHL